MKRTFTVFLFLIVAAAAAPTNYTPLSYREVEWYGSTFWTGPDWTRVGKDWHHPGQETPSVRRFAAPRDGRVTISGRVFKLHLSGDGVRAMIRHNDSEIWKVEIEGKDDKGGEPKLTLDVKKGDALRFIVHKRGNYGCDTTGWDPIVTYADGEKLQASASFTTKKQGAGNWFYEMEGSGPMAPAIVTAAPAPEEVTISPALQAALTKLAPKLAPQTEQALLAMVLEAWWREDKLDDTAKSYESAVSNHLARARALASSLGVPPPEALDGGAPDTLDAWRSRYLEVRLLKRELALGNPLLKFGEVLFCKRAMPSWSHEVAQYFGWRQRGGGGLYALRKPGYALATRNIMGSQLPMGSYLEPRLSYDGKRILFAFVACDAKTPAPTSLPVNEAGVDERYYHLFEIGVDGTGLRRLTSGPYDDMMAEYLPEGDLVFVSTRRKSYSRCFGPEYSPRWHSYTLHRCDRDGRNIQTLSYNDVSEWFPAVSRSGQILFARWDYIDRDAVTHQNLWSCRPDGSNPMAVWGNGLPSPHCTFQAKPIPGSQKLVFIAAAHHAITAGPVCLLDPSIGLNAPEAVERVTPLIYPEAERGPLLEWYEAPWPLSEDYFLVAYSPYRLRMQGEHAKEPNRDAALGVYLLDRRGNRELLYRDPALGATAPIPIAARPVPPVLASHLPANPPPHGEMMIYDVYQGLDGVPRGSIAAVRIIQIFPKTTVVANQPRMGLAGEENGRAILGTVPVESDGSARFLLPAGKKILFQALDKDGFARRIMRSSTYVQPGEVTACTGCHEYGGTTRPNQNNAPLALRRPPSTIEPGPLGGRPFSFVEVVQPVLDRHCVACHSGVTPKGKRDLTATPEKGFTRSYWSLCGNADSWKDRRLKPELDAQDLVPRYSQRNQIQITPPDDIRSARRSRLMRMLLDAPGHNKVKLSDDDIRRLAAWIDCNAIFYGVYDSAKQAKQLTGQPVAMPDIQ